MLLLSLLLYPTETEGKTEHNRDILESSLIASANPITVSGNWPKPKVPVISGGYGCIKTVRDAGYKTYRTLDGYARTMPVDSTEFPPEGVSVVIKTSEGRYGHILVARRTGGRFISVVEGGYPGGGVGRIVPNSVYMGFIIQ